MSGTRRLAAHNYLLGGLRDNSQKVYSQALLAFKAEMARQKLDFEALSEYDRDWVVAEYLLELHEHDPAA